MMYGQDRFRRRYWVLPHCGGVFIEAMESGEGIVSCASLGTVCVIALSSSIHVENILLS